MSKLFLPKGYKPLLDLEQTEKAIKFLKDFFQQGLSSSLRLKRVTAPLFVLKGTGLNDGLSGTERAVSFPIKDMNDRQAEVVHSLAKWKRVILSEHNVPAGYGIYTDMNAIRSDEELDNTHSLYVDQWDWERTLTPEERNLDFLQHIVRKIHCVLKDTEYQIYDNFGIRPELPEEITFLHTEELLQKYPDLSPKERENRICQEHGIVCLIGIGGKLSNGEAHDLRAPDYDDWTTPTESGYSGLNCDILMWNPILKSAFEISSMGIRVDAETLMKQLQLCGVEHHKNLEFHRRLLGGELPLSIGGGIGQSRLCMYFLRKAHIGETQSSIWPPDMIATCKKHSIYLMQ